MGFQANSGIPIITSLEPIELLKLSTPYPVPKAYVLERQPTDSNSIPQAPNVTDTSCGKCDDLIPITKSKLQCTISATDSAIIRDKATGDIIAIVIRAFAQDYYNEIKPWAVGVIKDSIHRRILSQRNGPGKLTRVGVTDGARNARVFRWFRSLKEKFRKDRCSDHDKHE